jgi:exonuclease III
VDFDRRHDKSKLRLIQYNVEWLFIDYCSSSDCPGNGCTWKNLTEAQTHMNYVNGVVNKLNPDIINFCEIEGCDELNMVKNSLDTSNSYNPYLKKGTDTSTGQNVGLLTRIDPLVNLYRDETHIAYPIEGSKCGYTETGSSGSSKHYMTEFAINDIKIAMIGAHLVAIPTDPPRCAQREAQAQVLQNNIYSYIEKGYEVIVLGDMNDFDAEVLDLNSNIPKSYVLDILKGSYGTYKNKYSLISSAIHVNQTKRYSDWYDSDNNCKTSSIKDYSMIDHILVTSTLNNKVKNVFMYHEYDEYCGKYNSDHYPVVVDFDFA